MTNRRSHIGPMSANSANVPHYMPERVEFDIPERVTNAGVRAPLLLSSIWKVPTRPGAMDAFSFLSKGTGC